MKYSDLNISVDKRTILLDQANINVLQYLPIEDKNDLIQIAIQNAEENGIYNMLKLQMYFELYCVYLYTDLEFTVEEKEDEVLLYNVLKSNGVIDAILAAIPEQELAEVRNYLDEMLHKQEKYNNSVAGALNNFINNLAPNAENAANII